MICILQLFLKMNLAFHVRIKGKSSRILPPHLNGYRKPWSFINRKKLSILCLIIISRDNFLIDLTDLVTGRSFIFVFQQRCFFINSSSLEFYVFQLEFRGINYCSFFIPPSSLILWPVKVYCFFPATV